MIQDKSEFNIIYCCICGWWHPDDGREDNVTTSCPECGHKSVNLEVGNEQWLYTRLRNCKE